MTNKPEITESLIDLAKTLIIGGVVTSSVDDAPQKSGGYTVEDLESIRESTDLHRIANAWVSAAIDANWNRAGAESKTGNELWQDLMYTLNGGCVAIGRKLRAGASVDDIVAEVTR